MFLHPAGSRDLISTCETSVIRCQGCRQCEREESHWIVQSCHNGPWLCLYLSSAELCLLTASLNVHLKVLKYKAGSRCEWAKLNLNLNQLSQRERKHFSILIFLPMISQASHKWKAPLSLPSIPGQAALGYSKLYQLPSPLSLFVLETPGEKIQRTISPASGHLEFLHSMRILSWNK